MVDAFNVGDKVRIIMTNSPEHNAVGEVVKVNQYVSCADDFDVKLPNGDILWYQADELELVEAAPSVSSTLTNSLHVGGIVMPSQVPFEINPNFPAPTLPAEILATFQPQRKKYDLTIVIGRFQPLHDGHVQLINQAKLLGNKTVIIMGSVCQPRSIKNPFSYEERMELLRKTFPDVRVQGLEDAQYDDEVWKRRFHIVVDYMLKDIGFAHGRDSSAKVAIVSSDKEGDKWREAFLPEYDHVYATITGEINATEVRELMWDAGDVFPRVAKLLPMPQASRDMVNSFINTDDYKRLVEERQMVKEYKASWASAPFPPVFVVVDNIVRWNDRILLIRRGDHPGKGLLAMPGGYIEVDETIKESALRELREETKLDTDTLRLAKVEVYDRPGRSGRGRMITHVHVWDVTTGDTEVAGGDDAEHAYWELIENIPDMRNYFFSDHHDIICNTLGIYWE